MAVKTTIIGQIPEPATSPDAQAPLPGATPVADGAGTGAADAEVGGRGGLDPVRYGDWEKNGRCIDF